LHAAITPAYLPPEAFAGQSAVQSDQYSLAVTYCHLRGGRLPFTGTAAQVLAGHLHQAADLTMVPEYERPILARALAKKPRERWPNCRAFVQALAECNRDPAASLASVGTLRRLQSRRGRWLLAGAGVVLLLGIVLPVLQALGLVALPLEKKIEPSRRGPSAQSPEARPPEPAQSTGFKRKTPRPARIPPGEFFDWQPDELEAVFGEHRGRHWGPVNCLAVSPDGKWLASAGADEIIHIWDGETLQELRTLRFPPEPQEPLAGDPTYGAIPPYPLPFPGISPRPVRSLAIHPQGQLLVAGGRNGSLVLWDVRAGKELRSFGAHLSAVTALAFSPEGNHLLSGSEERTVRMWDTKSYKAIQTLKGHTGFILSVCFSPDGSRAVTGSADKTAKIWDLESGKALHTLADHQSEVWSVAFSPDGKQVAVGSGDHRDLPEEKKTFVVLWDAETGKEARRLRGFSWGNVMAVGYASDGRSLLAATDWERILLRWDLETGKSLRLIGHNKEITTAALTAGGSRAVSASLDGSLRLWDLTTGNEIAIPNGHKTGVTSIAFAPNGRQLLSCARDMTTRLWDVDTGEQIWRLTNSSGLIYSNEFRAAFAGDGKAFLAGQDHVEPRCELWDLEKFNKLHSFPGHGGIQCSSFARDGSRAVTGGSDKKIIVWDVKAGKSLRTWVQPEAAWSVAISADGKRAVSGGEARVRLWDVEADKELNQFKFDGGQAKSVALSPDGHLAISGGSDGVVRLWNVTDGAYEHAGTLRRHRGEVKAVAVANDSQTYATAGEDGKIILGDPAGRRLKEWQLPGPINDLTFSPDDGRLATANSNGTIYLLRVDKEMPEKPARDADDLIKQLRDASKFRLADSLASRIKLAKQQIEKHPTAHVIVGRVLAEEEPNPARIKAQMQIVEEGYFVGAVKEAGRRVGFRLHGWQPVDLIPAGKPAAVEYVGTLRLKSLSEEMTAGFTAKVVLADEPNAAKANVTLSITMGPINTPNDAVEPRAGDAEPYVVKPGVSPAGVVRCGGLTPTEYSLSVTAPGYVEHYRLITFRPGQTTDLGTIKLEKEK
jgi:WD40 repeat protein